MPGLPERLQTTQESLHKRLLPAQAGARGGRGAWIHATSRNGSFRTAWAWLCARACAWHWEMDSEALCLSLPQDLAIPQRGGVGGAVGREEHKEFAQMNVYRTVASREQQEKDR